jgi:hypothetical protein
MDNVLFAASSTRNWPNLASVFLSKPNTSGVHLIVYLINLSLFLSDSQNVGLFLSVLIRLVNTSSFELDQIGFPLQDLFFL